MALTYLFYCVFPMTNLFFFVPSFFPFLFKKTAQEHISNIISPSGTKIQNHTMLLRHYCHGTISTVSFLFLSLVYLLRGWQMVSRTLETSLGLKNPCNLFWNPNVTCILVRLNGTLNFASEGSCNINSTETFCFLNCSFMYLIVNIVNRQFLSMPI